jgi:hypothetical protein
LVQTGFVNCPPVWISPTICRVNLNYLFFIRIEPSNLLIPINQPEDLADLIGHPPRVTRVTASAVLPQFKIYVCVGPNTVGSAVGVKP